MIKTLITKLFSIALMIAAPIISGMAFLEYYHVKFQHLKPKYPFGAWMSNEFLSYEKAILYIGIGSLLFAVLAYLSLMIKSLIRILIILFVVTIVYYFYKKLV
jgi:hypothetical protein